jgi:hypothetical protein
VTEPGLASGDVLSDAQLDALVAGAEGGIVTSADVFAACPTLEPETAHLVAIQEQLRARGVEWVDEVADGATALAGAPLRRRAARRRARGRPRSW